MTEHYLISSDGGAAKEKSSQEGAVRSEGKTPSSGQRDTAGKKESTADEAKDSNGGGESGEPRKKLKWRVRNTLRLYGILFC